MSYHPDIHGKASRNSTCVVFTLDGKTLTGFVMATGDGVLQAAVYDVAIHLSYQGEGLGKILIEKIREKLSGCNIILYVLPDKGFLSQAWIQ